MLAHARLAVTVASLLSCMIISAVTGRRRWSGSVQLALLSLLSLNIDSDFEGPELYRIDPAHGLVLADLIGLGGLAVAAGQMLVHLTRQRRVSRSGR